MPTSNENFFSRERLQDLALGLGRGLQEQNFSSSFGAALSGTVGANMARQARKEARDERTQDLEKIEEKQIRGEERQRGYARESTAEQRKYEKESTDEQRKYAEELKDKEREYYRKSRVLLADKGRARVDNSMFNEFFAGLFGGNRQRVPGKSPVDVYDFPELDSSTADVGPNASLSGLDSFDPYLQDIMLGARKQNLSSEEKFAFDPLSQDSSVQGDM